MPMLEIVGKITLTKLNLLGEGPTILLYIYYRQLGTINPLEKLNEKRDDMTQANLPL